jgi:hypothetical protein
MADLAVAIELSLSVVTCNPRALMAELREELTELDAPTPRAYEAGIRGFQLSERKPILRPWFDALRKAGLPEE